MNVTNRKQVLKAGDTLIERGTSSFFYCCEASAPFVLRMSDGSCIDMSSRRKINLEKPLDIFYLENTSDHDIQLEYVMGFGDFADDSMFVEGQIEIATASNKHVNTLSKKLKIAREPQELTIGASGFLEIDPSNFAWCRIQNISSKNLRLYSANGFILAPMGVEELQLAEPFKVYGTSGDKLVFGGFA